MSAAQLSTQPKSPLPNRPLIPRSTIFGSAQWFQSLTSEQQLLVDRIDRFANKAKRGVPSDDIEYFAQKWLYDWAFEQINSNHNDWEKSFYIPLVFQVEEVENGDPTDCITLFYRYGDNEEHAYLKINLI